MEEKSKIIFYTIRKDHNIDYNSYHIIESPDLIIKSLEENKEFFIDTENNSLIPFDSTMLLLSLYDGSHRIVIDITCVDISFMEKYRHKRFIGHNIQYDCRIIEWHTGIVFTNVYDTMISEQILTRGAYMFYGLEEVHKRRLNKPMEEDKGTRSDFISMSKNSKFIDEHIRYSAYDVVCLKPIKEDQEYYIAKNNLQYRVHIGNQVVPLLASMCLEGIHINKQKWRDRIIEDKQIKIRLEKELDEEINKLSKEYPKLRGGAYTRKRKTQIIIQPSLFNSDIIIENENKGNINYSSQQQVLEVFKRSAQSYPTKTDNKTYDVKKSIGKDALEQYLIDNPDSKLFNFCKILIKHAETVKAINSFGEIFLCDIYKKKTTTVRGFLQPKTGKIHTIYKAESTKNGRLTSGDTKLGFYNSQQVNKQQRYRHCFTLSQKEIEEGYFISTIDLSGAELIILAALSGDIKLAELQASDIHSYLATAAFNKIIRYILTHITGKRQQDELYDLLKVNKIYKSKSYCNKELKNKKGEIIGTLTHSLCGQPLTDKDCHRLTIARIKSVLKNGKIAINKRTWKDIRDPFKNVVYGSSYGAQAAKVASTLNIAKDFAELVIQSMTDSLPIAFGYLDVQSNFGVKNGYIIFNKRTNSRFWFSSVLDSRKYGRELNFKDKGRVERQCKNLPISGTQADMIKEAMVFIKKFISIYKIDAKILLQVHDELVIKHKRKELGKIFAKIMTNVANKYLSNGITMKADADTLYTWTK